MRYLKFPCLFVFLLVLASCKDESQTTIATVSANDVQEISTLYEQNLFSLKLAEDALLRSTLKETKDVAAKIIANNNSVKDEIEVVAGKKSFNVPMDMNEKHLSEWRNLVREIGWNFDKKFLSKAITIDSLKTIQLTKIISEVNDLQIKEVAQKIQQQSQSKALTADIKNLIFEHETKDTLVSTVAFN